MRVKRLFVISMLSLLLTGSFSCNREDGTANPNASEIPADTWQEAAGNDVIPTYVSTNCHQLADVFKQLYSAVFLPIEDPFQRKLCEGSMGEGHVVCPCRSGGNVSTTVSGSSWEKTLVNCDDRQRSAASSDSLEEIFIGTVRRICNDAHCLYDKFIYDLEKAGACRSLKGTVVVKTARVDESNKPLTCEGGVTATCNDIEETCVAALDPRSNHCISE